jgi:hypothetical protein
MVSICREPTVLTAEQLLDKINKLRKDYSDDPEDETYQALHHTMLFMSYKVGLLKEYLQEAAERERASQPG